ncbi:type II toxin-antitoxin system MqsA family antitoxin [Pectobacterium brasiliense]|uniref:Type II toxin-antitoxin system MqsA family antitoxin n=1 Tax=Pectobacterium brasiliense TaxID=180957 RepID=A0AAE3BDG2_9GAMM|nr:type II toxin-antitoxin system MqsA family antitoxin [Pectobacterium brasiliense]MBN3050842.1 type II toxin-antitoxin system MqsA family antitoxin [Pectobacterium brasiliense]
MKCPSCGGAELVFMVKDVPYTFQGNTVEIEVKGEHCPQCGEVVLNADESDEYRVKMRKARDEIMSKFAI